MSLAMQGLSRRRMREERSWAVFGMDTLPRLFRHVVAERGGKVAMREKELGIWRAISWREYGERAKRVGLGLVALGLEPRDVVSILADNCPEWLYTDLGVLCAGGVTNGIYTTDSAAQVEYIVNDSGTRFFFADNEEQLDKILQVRGRCPQLVKIFVYDMEGLHGFADPQVMPFSELLELGARYDEEHPGAFDRLVEIARPNDVAILVYTSGTTGPPKGAMLSHRNILFQLDYSDFIIQAGGGRSAALVPAALPYRRAHLLRLQSTALRLYRQLRREHRDRPGEHPRGGARAVLRGAPDLGEVLLRRRAAHARGDGAGAARLPLGDRDRHARGGVPPPGPAALGGAHAPASRGGLARARQSPALDGPAPGARRRDGRRAHRPGADPVVPGTRHRHAGGLWADGELRPRHGHAGRADQARHRRGRPAGYRDPDLARGGDPPEGAAYLPRLLQPTRQDGRDRRGRVAPHRRRRAHGRRRLRHDHGSHEGPDHHRGGQEHHPVGDREPAQVLALHLGRGGDRRQAEVPVVPRHDRPRDGGAVRPGAERARSRTSPRSVAPRKCRT